MSAEPRTVLVTGASRGVGAAAAKALRAGGYRVIGLARSMSDADAADGFVPYAADLSDLDQLPQQLADIAKRHPEISAIVANAGVGRFGSLEEFSYAQIRTLADLNFTSQAFLARAFMPVLKRHECSDLVFIGSEAALSGGRRGALYSATKAALRGFAQALRDECARSGARVCIINPGAVRSSFFDELSFRPGDGDDHALLPEDVAAAVVQVLGQRAGAVIDEINLSPLKKVWQFDGGTGGKRD